MTKMSKAALLATLMAGLSLPLATPALAKKKKEEPAAQGPQLSINAKVREGYSAALKIINDGSALSRAGNNAGAVAMWETATPLLDAAQAAAVNNDEQYVVTELRYQQQSRILSTRPSATNAGASNGTLGPLLDKLIANPSTPKEAAAKYAMERARMQYLSNEFRPALATLKRAQALGSTDPQLGPMIVDTNIKIGDYATAAAEGDRMIVAMKAAGQPVPEAFYLVGRENAYRSKNTAAAIQYDQRRLAEYPTTKNLYDAIILLMERSGLAFGPDARAARLQRLDAFRLLRYADALSGETAIRNYAIDATNAGAGREAFAVLEKFRAGRPVASLDADTRTAYVAAKAYEDSAQPLATTEAKARAGSDFQSALTAANFNYAAGNYAKAAEFYTLAEQRGAPDKDQILMSRGASLAYTGDKAGALASFAAVQSSPRKEIAGYWTTWLNKP